MAATYEVTIHVFEADANNTITAVQKAGASCGLHVRLLKKKSYIATVRSIRGMDNYIRLQKARLKFEISGGNDTVVNAFSAGLARKA